MVVKDPIIQRIPLKLQDYEIWIVLVLVGCGLVWYQLLPVSLIGIIFLFTIRWWTTRKFFPQTITNLALALLSFFVVFSWFISPQPKESLLQISRFFLGVGLLLSIVNWATSSKRLRLFLLSVVSSVVILAILSPYLVNWSDEILFFSTDFYRDLPVIVSDTINANVMAGVFILFVPLLFSLILFALPLLARIEVLVYLIALIIVTLALFLTQSRGAFLAAFIGLLSILLIRWRKGKWVFLAILAIVFLLGFLNNWQRMTDVINTGSKLQNLSGRLEVWSRALYMLEDFGLTGAGMGMFGYMADALYPFDSFIPGTMEHAHNLFLQIGVDIGIPGLISWLAIVELILIANWKVIQGEGKLRDEWNSAVAAGLFSGQVAMLSHGFVDAVHWGLPRSSIVVWLFWGISLALFNIHQNSETSAI